MSKVEALTSKGIRRHGTPEKGFTYTSPRGSFDPEDLARIEALRIPPAWEDVAISLSTGAALQAVGKDSAGRWQYLYHESFVRRRERKKFERQLAFAEALPRARPRVSRQLTSAPPLSRERVLATMVRILMRTYLRPGSAEYLEKNGSYGLTTLRKRHVSVRGDRIRFDFNGKGGKRQLVELTDRTLAREIRRLASLPGDPFFRYRNGGGALVAVRSADLNVYIREALGGPYTAKDFRTWAGTFTCAAELAQRSVDSRLSARERKRVLVEAIRKTAGVLQNTPAIARASYIDPRVIRSFEKGRPSRPAGSPLPGAP